MENRNPKSARDEIKLAYLAGLQAGVFLNKSHMKNTEKKELLKNATTGAEYAFQGGTHRGPFPVFEAINYFDSLFPDP